MGALEKGPKGRNGPKRLVKAAGVAMKSGLLWAYVASVVVHMTVVVAVSWLQVNAATAPSRTAWVDVSFVEAEGEHGTGGDGMVDETVEREENGPDGLDGQEAIAEEAEEERPKELEEPKRPEKDQKRSRASEERRSTELIEEPERTAEAGVPGEEAGGSAGASPSPPATGTLAKDTSRSAVPVQGPSVVRVVEPVYPRSARRAGHEGRVVVEAAVEANGRVDGVLVVESSGFGDLDEAAVKAARKSRFSPATRGGVPVGSSKRLMFRFVLEE